jgi:glycosyltransferase involved in cell wall biosynthesis
MPLISVIIPVYNGEKTIRETVFSVLNQTMPNFELIIINDGSQDSTLEIVSRIPDPRVKIFSFANAGLAVSRNRGIALANGDYLAFLDADDLWADNKLEAQLAALKENPEAAVAYSWTDCIDGQGRFLRQSAHATASGNVQANLLLANFISSGSNVFVRKQAVVDVGGFDESLSNAQDWDLWLRLAARYEFVPVPETQVFYRVSPHSMSTNVLGLEVSMQKVIRRSFEQAPPTLQHLQRYSQANCYKYLTFKALQGLPTKQQSWLALRYLWSAVRYDPGLLKKRVAWKALCKTLLGISLPFWLLQALMEKISPLFNLQSLLAYIRSDPAEFAASKQ